MNASGVIVNGLQLAVPGLRVVNYRDEPAIRLKIGEDGTARPRVLIDYVVLHTTLGAPDNTFKHSQQVIEGAGPATDVGKQLAQMWGTDGRCAGSHLAIGFDGTVYCLCDLLLEESFHATTVNLHSVGIEYQQGRQSELYSVQLEAGRRLVDWLTLYFEIPRMIPLGYKGIPIPQLAVGGHGYRGVFGHRDQSIQRGAGDPGDFVMQSLRYRAIDVAGGAYVTYWQAVQRWLGFSGTDVDGDPGPHTFRALRARGFAGGQISLPPAGLRLPPELAAAA